MLQILDVASLWIIWWCAATGLAGAPDDRSWKAWVLKAALLVVSLSAFMGGVTLFTQPQPIRVWASGFLYGVAVISVWWYDYRFGIAGQLGMARRWARSVPDGIRARIKRGRP
jgi:hypothetical protein